MSSFNTHKRHVLDKNEPLNHRYSHLRSCVNKIANLLSCSRQELIGCIKRETGINVEETSTEENLLKAFNFMLQIRIENL